MTTIGLFSCLSCMLTTCFLLLNAFVMKMDFERHFDLQTNNTSHVNCNYEIAKTIHYKSSHLARRVFAISRITVEMLCDCSCVIGLIDLARLKLLDESLLIL